MQDGKNLICSKNADLIWEAIEINNVTIRLVYAMFFIEKLHRIRRDSVPHHLFLNDITVKSNKLFEMIFSRCTRRRFS